MNRNVIFPDPATVQERDTYTVVANDEELMFLRVGRRAIEALPTGNGETHTNDPQGAPK